MWQGCSYPIKPGKLFLQCRTVAEDHDLDLTPVKSYACGNSIPLFVSAGYTIPAVLCVIKQGYLITRILHGGVRREQLPSRCAGEDDRQRTQSHFWWQKWKDNCYSCFCRGPRITFQLLFLVSSVPYHEWASENTVSWMVVGMLLAQWMVGCGHFTFILDFCRPPFSSVCFKSSFMGAAGLPMHNFMLLNTKGYSVLLCLWIISHSNLRQYYLKIKM